MSTLLARALGSGVQVAALTPYTKWQQLLLARESLGGTIEDGDSVATYELLPVQALDDLGEETIEVRVLAADGHRQLTAYYYARPGS